MPELLHILLDTPQFVALNKPPGVSVHNDRGEQGFVSGVRQQLNEQALLPVHRLDKETSGVIILAKGSVNAAKLGELFQNKTIDKYYWAISDKKGKKKQGAIVGDMEKSRNGDWKLTRSFNNPASTHFFSYGLGGGLRAFILRPKTGKTHQIRVALKSLGCPILGDLRYKGNQSDRMYLHARQLSFSLDGEHYEIAAPFLEGDHFLSPEFRSKVDGVENPSHLGWPQKTT